MALGKRKPFHTKHRKRKIFWRRIVVGSASVVVLATVLVAVFYGTRLTLFSVHGVSVRGLETVSEAEVYSRVDAQLAGTYYGIVPHRFAPTVPSKRIEESVESIARVASATVAVEGTDIVVTVTEHSPDMLWCGVATSSTCYYVDGEGYAYESAPVLTGSAFMRFVTHGREPVLNTQVLDSTTRSLLVAIARLFEERHAFRVHRIEYTENSDAILHLSQGGRVLVATTRNLEETYDNLSSILATEEYASLTPGTFEYIDLRFGNKVFVQKEKPTASTTASTTVGVE
jgi:cell division septal protein FtsQ